MKNHVWTFLFIAFVVLTSSGWKTYPGAICNTVGFDKDYAIYNYASVQHTDDVSDGFYECALNSSRDQYTSSGLSRSNPGESSSSADITVIIEDYHTTRDVSCWLEKHYPLISSISVSTPPISTSGTGRIALSWDLDTAFSSNGWFYNYNVVCELPKFDNATGGGAGIIAITSRYE